MHASQRGLRLGRHVPSCSTHMRISWRHTRDRGRSGARSNGNKQYLSVCGVHDGPVGATAEVGVEN